MLKNNYKNRASLISFITLSLVVSSLATPVAAKADVVQENECFPAVLMLKGSGEGAPNLLPKDYIPSNSTTNKSFIILTVTKVLR